MKKLIAAVLLAILVLGGFLFYRTSHKATADSEGNPLRLSYEDIDEQGRTGVFVHNSDGTFSPAIQAMPNFDGETEDSSPERFIWYVESDKDLDDMIPTVTSDSELVIIYNIDGDLPGSYYLEKYALKGYTIGAHILLDQSKNMYLSSEDPLSGSQAASRIQEMQKNTDGVYVVGEISGADSLPIENVDPNMDLLLGLTKDKLYRITYYQGTKKRDATFKADAKVFQSERFIPISTPYKKTQKGYFIVNLPQNLADGYYYLSDIGFFSYRKDGSNE